MNLLTLLLLSSSLLSVLAITDDFIEEDKKVSLNEFLSTAQVDGIISASQLLKLQQLANKLGVLLDDEVSEGQSVQESKDATVTASPGIFMKLYNRLTLLNVLYFGGALLVMGAATLFMTLAWERFSGISLFFLIAAMSACAGTAGVTLWKMEEYEMAGGVYVKVIHIIIIIYYIISLLYFVIIYNYVFGLYFTCTATVSGKS